MKGYDYQLVRYIHDMVTEEFVNVGIIFYVPEENFLKSRSTHKYKRISDFFGPFNGDFLIATLKQIDRSIDKASLKNYKDLIEITYSILPKNDSALQLSEVHKGISLDFEKTFESLYERHIGVFETTSKRKSRTDHDAWRSTYKKYFDQYGITKKLKEHTIKTNLDEIKFEYSYKNHIWHCFEPVSFDLLDTDSIKDKGYRWAGRITSLSASKEKFKLYFLTLPPSTTEAHELNSFIETLLKQSAHGKEQVEIVKEADAEEFAVRIKELTETN